jgi:hypothetical protein
VKNRVIADLAEDMPLAGPASAADVVVLARDADGVVRATRPYDSRVAGIVTTSSGVVFQVETGKQTVPVALTGIVMARATSSGGPIRRGDLLTTSGTPGHLMRCKVVLRCVGAIVGKAMDPLPRGARQIRVLLWRQ